MEAKLAACANLQTSLRPVGAPEPLLVAAGKNNGGRREQEGVLAERRETNLPKSPRQYLEPGQVVLIAGNAIAHNLSLFF